jgi:HK97 family phage major capsid protein
MTITEMRNARSAKISEARKILDTAQREGREPTMDERQRFDALLDDADGLRLQIDEASCSEPLPRRTTPWLFGSARRPEDRLIRHDQPLATMQPGAISEPIDLARMVGRAAGFDVPATPTELKMLAEGQDSSGGFAVPTFTSAQILDIAREKSVIFRSGARTLEMRSSKEILPTLNSDFTPVWKAEGATCETSGGQFGAVHLTAKTLMAYIVLSNELLADAPSMGQFLQSAIGESLAKELDRAALLGTGESEQPLGVFYHPEIKTIAPVGESFTYDDLIDGIGQIEAENFTPTATICSPGTLTHFRRLKDNEGRYLRPPEMPPMIATSKIADSFGDGLQAAMITGDFSQLAIGVRMGLRIAVSREARISSYETAIAAVLRADVAVLRPSAFVKIGPASI